MTQDIDDMQRLRDFVGGMDHMQVTYNAKQIV